MGAIVSLALALPSAAQMPPPALPGDTPAGQPAYPACQPPSPGEYLLLVVSKTPEAQQKVRQVLPASAKATLCNYLDDVVTRVSGFSTVDTANAWVKYLNESAGLVAFVARPTETAAATPPTPPTPPFPGLSEPPPQTTPVPAKPAPVKPATPTPAKPATVAPATTTLAFNPRQLGTGYAVLVNYFNQPELATKVHQLLGRDVGLVSYGQRPYLLAVYTTDHAAANATLQRLTDRGFWAMVVDSRRVTLLKQTVNLKQASTKSAAQETSAKGN
jgi:hypothetical protein